MASDEEDIGVPEMHPNKRVKTLTLSSPESSPSSSDKGKSKLELSNLETEQDCCGICLTETGHGTTIIRGVIDCCNHYFCFVCIIEWSKVESRCPMCKRRFSIIRRPARPPIFPSERVVNVPVRDQVYHCHGNATTGPRDLYAEVQCNVCHSTADDVLLLLCDLCDTAYHTYCVGLGATVPEGDWFCADCALLKAEQAQSDIKTDCCTQTSFGEPQSAESTRQVSIYDIVRESRVDGVESTPTGALDASDSSSRIESRRQSTSRSSSIRLGSVGNNGVAGRTTKFNARTLGHCRNVHDRIRILREHWNGFRSGSLRFPSSKVTNASSAKLKPVRGSNSAERPLVCCSSQPRTSQPSNQNRPDSKGPTEVKKAWKMMNMAKAIEQNSVGNKSSVQASKHSVQKNTSYKEASESSSTSIKMKIEQHRPPYIQNVGPGSHSENDVCKLDIGSKGASGVYKGSSMSCRPLYSELVSSRESQNSLQPYVCDANNGLPWKNKSCAGATHLSSSIRLTSISTTVGHEKEISSSSNSIVNPQEKLKVEKSVTKRRVEVKSDAKTEIQSLVKLNLKILCGDKKLEVDTFKQVARVATHSILAACGLEHKTHGISSLPECVCVHSEEDKELSRSTLMPKSCRECFFLFVKNVVNTVLLDKR
ncbi:uncharacterized protein [Solanum lycopersicum]|uniref:PHD-type domain-containing protein n=1 Tax=Solanum lycopersicum TaxID=4081 RepID=A0A3Q7GXG7_SOLLC|nr:uncharacterized protein LOC101264529 [Solanum lycopersicum]